MSEKYFFASYYWTRQSGEQEADNFIFKGSFLGLVKKLQKSKQNMKLVWCKEITIKDFWNLDKVGVDNFTV